MLLSSQNYETFPSFPQTPAPKQNNPSTFPDHPRCRAGVANC